MFDQTAEERFEDTLDALDAAMEELALVAATATSSSTQVKAISAKVGVIKQKRRMLDEAGLLPRWSPRPLGEGAHYVLAITDILKRHDVPLAVIYECADVVEAWTDDRPLSHQVVPA